LGKLAQFIEHIFLYLLAIVMPGVDSNYM